MSSYLQQQIQTRMDAMGLSVYALEKKAGLKRSAVRNILQGFSKKPSADVVGAIASALDCGLGDLVGDTDGSTIKQKKKGISWEENLYVDAVRSIGKYLQNARHLSSFEQVQYLISETYKYSMAKDKPKIDDDFSKWLVEKNG